MGDHPVRALLVASIIGFSGIAVLEPPVSASAPSKYCSYVTVNEAKVLMGAKPYEAPAGANQCTFVLFSDPAGPGRKTLGSLTVTVTDDPTDINQVSALLHRHPSLWPPNPNGQPLAKQFLTFSGTPGVAFTSGNPNKVESLSGDPSPRILTLMIRQGQVIEVQISGLLRPARIAKLVIADVISQVKPVDEG
jgi:hypothetical protein